MAPAWKRNVPQGLSLVEITLSMLVFGIFAAIAIPKYADSLMRYRAEVTANRIAQDLAQAQSRARLTNANCSMSLSTASDSYTISGLKSLDKPSENYVVSLSKAPFQCDIQFLATETNPTAGLSDLAIQFNRFGMPDKGCIITVSRGGYSKTVTLESVSGRVKIQ
jgi:prepilin-type N-terminal cleavage/methylation domain-containing protein